jgi:hypothetical protein
MAAKRPEPEMDPTKMIVSKKRALHLATLAKLDVKELAGKKIGEVNELLKWRVDPKLLLFRRVCGRVVKKNPDGSFCPVPGATVHVEDTDCSFLGFFPVESPFFWLFPIKCRKEEIATVTTDACGRFCVYLPFWDIDRILRIRRTRICLPLLYRPHLRDIIEYLPEPPVIRKPKPEPEPILSQCICRETMEEVRATFGSGMVDRLEQLLVNRSIGGSAAELEQLLDSPLPTSPPPLPSFLLQSTKADLGMLAERISIDEGLLRKIDFTRFIGPFYGCRDVWRLQWVPFLDIPDITFSVTQDVDGDGTEETIYQEGFFDVRWNAEQLLNVTLVANANAVCVPICEPVPEIPCENVPAISTAGYMTLQDSHHDNDTGYGRRVNRPSPVPGNYPPPPSPGAGGNTAVSPYAGSLNLHGCHRINQATHYRLTYILDGIGSAVPFTGIAWWAPRSAAAPGPPIHIVPDPGGWYPILDASILEHPSWLLHWNTGIVANGTYEVRLEVGTPGGGGMTVLATSDPVKFTVDNRQPDAAFLEIRWRYADVAGAWTDANSTLLPAICPVINRNLARGAVRVRVLWQASATHLRNAELTFSGCGAGNPILVQPTPAAPDIEEYRHWHVHKDDNSISQANEYEIPASLDPGCYSLWIKAVSRAFNPNGFDHGPTADWLINQDLHWRYAHRAISLVNL